MPDNQEHTIGNISSSNGDYLGFITRSNGYCFLRLNKSSADYRFFFKCDALTTGEGYFRVLNDECPYPPVNPPSPPAEEVCYLYAKRASDNVQNIVTAIGEKNAQGFFNCYLKIVEERQPNLESMCTREAVYSEWQAITQTDLKKSVDGMNKWTDEKGVTHYEIPKETNTTVVQAG